MQSDSTSTLMIEHDDHGQALWTYPTHRHQSSRNSQETKQLHNVMKFSRLVHNHPSGDPMPSQGDIDMTKAIVAAGHPLKITVHDHLIVGREGVASLRQI